MLINWLPKLIEQLRLVKESVLYPQMVEVLTAFLRMDSNFMAELALWASGLAVEGAIVDPTDRTRSFVKECDRFNNELDQLRPRGIEETELVAM